MKTQLPKQTLSPLVDKLASQCVKCALCLPHCPTYELTKDENESPRGRIALFQALAQEKLDFSEKAHAHLDQCLGCRACERVCPAHVEYGQLLTLGRALLPELPAKTPVKPIKWRTRFLSSVLINTAYRQVLQWFLWIIQASGLRKVAQILKIPSLLGIANLEALLPTVQRPIKLKALYPTSGKRQGSVMLFTGCLSSLCDQETIAASIFVLNQLGMDVHVPSSQTCCGAMHTHAGDIQQAHLLAKQNATAFLETGGDFIVTVATGCSAVLQEYASHFSFSPDLNDPSFSRFSPKVIDIISFFEQTVWPSSLKQKTLAGHAILHTPCTRRNVLKSASDVEHCLSQIPGLTWQSFKSTHCCGAAGTYMLEHPEIASPLAQNLLKELDSVQVNFIVTTNIGCSLHLYQQVKQQHPQVKVAHPITLLAKTLGF